jgi:hypothetical protein
MKFLNSYFEIPGYFVCYTKVTELPQLPAGNRTAELGHGARTKVNYAIRLVNSLRLLSYTVLPGRHCYSDTLRSLCYPGARQASNEWPHIWRNCVSSIGRLTSFVTLR